MNRTRNPTAVGGAPKPQELPAVWRSTAEQLRAHAAHGAAKAYERAAEQLESSAMAANEQLLSLKDAAHECGFSTRTLRRWIETGQLPNIGRRNAPKIRRGDLIGHKHGLRDQSGHLQDADTQIEQIVRAIVTNGQDGYDG